MIENSNTFMCNKRYYIYIVLRTKTEEYLYGYFR